MFHARTVVGLVESVGVISTGDSPSDVAKSQTSSVVEKAVGWAHVK
jgi:hypothetical protein